MEGAINEEEVVEKNEEITEAADDAEPEPEPEPDNTMTLAEYMASKGQKEEKTGREVENEFKGLPAAVKKEEEDFLVMGGGKQKKSKKKNDEKKQSIELGFRPVSAVLASDMVHTMQKPIGSHQFLPLFFNTRRIPTAIGVSAAAEVVADVDEATVMVEEAAAKVEEAAAKVEEAAAKVEEDSKVEEEVAAEDEMVEEVVDVMDEDADEAEEEEIRKVSMFRTRTPSLHCR
jgi:hypothetical protein